MIIHTLASSSAGNAYALEADGRWLLLEAGLRHEKLRRALLDLGSGFAKLDGCVLTHEHGDHAVGMHGVAASGVDIYASEGTHKVLGTPPHRAATVSIAKWQATQRGDWYLYPFLVRHDAEEPLGYVIARGKDRVLFITDAAYAPRHFKGLTHVMIEANYDRETIRRAAEQGAYPQEHRARLLRNHMSIDRAARYLSEIDTSRLVGVWLLHLSSGNSDAENFRQRIMQVTGRPTHIAAA